VKWRRLSLPFCVLLACAKPYEPGPVSGPADAAVDAGDAAPANCDVDKDGWPAASCADAGEADCDDDDPDVHPGQDWLAVTPRSTRNGDWNCKDGVEKRFPNGVDCSGFSTSCAGREGFEDDPGCGQEGEFITCTMLTSTCTTNRSRRKQECR
jgi:hypothetical protein